MYGQCFENSVKRCGNRVFLRYKDQNVTYHQMERFVQTRYNEMKYLLQKGERYMIQDQNTIPFVIEMLACWRKECTFIPVTTHLTNLQPFWKKVHPSPHSICPKRFATKNSVDDRFALILFTSGTSDTPKAVPLTASNILSNLKMIEERVGNDITHHDISLSHLPWFHVYGLVCELLFLMRKGASIILPDRPLPIYLNRIRYYEPTLMFTVPKLLNRIYQKTAFYKPISFLLPRILFGKKLRMISSGGAALDDQTKDYFIHHLHIPIIQGYGMSESSPMISLSSLRDYENTYQGKVFEGIQYRIQDTLHIKGENVFHGYLNDDNSLDKSCFDKDGWLVTKDVVTIDKDRQLRFMERKDTLLKMSNGKFLNPKDIEEKVQSFFSKYVEQCCVGCHPLDGHLVMVVVPKRLHASDFLIHFIRSEMEKWTELEHYMKPQDIIIHKDVFTPQNQMLTLKMEPNRKRIMDYIFHHKKK